MKLALPRLRTISLLLLALAATVRPTSALALLASTFAQPQSPPATIVMCVNVNVLPGGSGDGSSWADAFTSLDAALAAAPNGASLWVAQGTYKPATLATGFQITKHLKVFGGFVGDGTENSLASRHGSFQATVLDAEFGNPFDISDNANHVVSIDMIDGAGEDPGVVIDGFRIANAWCNTLPVPNGNGAGIWCHCSDLDVANCFFDHNYAHDGGAIWFVSGCPAVPPPEVPEPYLTSILRVKSCEFFDNTADHDGGAIFAERVRGWVVNSKFIQNMGNVDGGAAFVWRVRSSHSLDFANCVFWENGLTAGTAKGGALAFGEFSTAADDSARSNVVNCTLAGNFLIKVQIDPLSPVCGAGQAVSVSPNSVVGIYNSILYYNHDLCTGFCDLPSAPPIEGNPTVDYSCVQYGWPGSHNISAIPLFTAGHPLHTTYVAGCAHPPTAILPLLTLRKASATVLGSPCIDRADYGRLPLDLGDLDEDFDLNEVLPVDLLEALRWVDRHGFGEDPNHGAPPGGIDYTDMGAYERP